MAMSLRWVGLSWSWLCVVELGRVKLCFSVEVFYVSQSP